MSTTHCQFQKLIPGKLYCFDGKGGFFFVKDDGCSYGYTPISISKGEVFLYIGKAISIDYMKKQFEADTDVFIYKEKISTLNLRYIFGPNRRTFPLFELV